MEINGFGRTDLKIKILVADDDRVLRELLCDILKSHGYEPIATGNGQEALKLFFGDPQIDLVILDVLMPKADGWEVLKEIRRESEVPVLMLTALGDEIHEVKGLKNGANDYVSKPFSHDVFISRVDVLLRKTKQIRNSQIHLSDLRIDLKQNKVFILDKEVFLNHKEYALLVYFYENRNIVLSRSKILDDIWGFDYDGDLRNVDTHVKMLRSKLGHAESLIKTIRGSGYMLEVQLEDLH
jgi:DNA-binding response OmpR family regulator